MRTEGGVCEQTNRESLNYSRMILWVALSGRIWIYLRLCLKCLKCLKIWHVLFVMSDSASVCALFDTYGYALKALCGKHWQV